MQKIRVLIIGAPFSYNLVDYELLKSNDIEPILSYCKGVQALAEGTSVYYDTLSLDEVARIIEDNGIQAIVCFNDNFLIQAAQLRSRYDMPGIRYPEIKKYKIKSEMYRILSPHLATPKTLNFNEAFTFRDIAEHLEGGEFFIKPDNLAGAEGSCHIRNEIDYNVWLQSKFNSANAYLVQRYYSDPLYHCELVVRNNEIKYIQARRYSYPNHKFLDGKIIASFPVKDNSFQRLIERESIRVQEQLGFENGIMHTEFFVGNDFKPVFLETNIRPAGGAINLVHKRRAGISLETMMILLELNIDFGLSLCETHLFDLCGYIPLKQGQVSKIELPNLKGHYNFDIRVQVGLHYDAPKSASNTAVAFVGYSSVYDELVDDFFSLENNDIIKYN